MEDDMPRSATAEDQLPRTQSSSASSQSAASNPGYTRWKTKIFLPGGGKLSQMSKFDGETSRFYQIVNIQRNDAFKLKNVVISHGPFKGKRALIVESFTDFFRILDLPPEIRSMVYIELFEEYGSIPLETYKFSNRERRPVGYGFTDSHRHPRQIWDTSTGKWSNHVPSAYSLLRVNRQMLAEAGSVAYSANVFSVRDLPQLRIFLNHIGYMRKYLRAIEFRGYQYHNTAATSVFHKLKDAKELRSVAFPHAALCEGYDHFRRTSLERVVSDATPLVKTLYKTLKAASKPNEVFNIFRVKHENGTGYCESGMQSGECKCIHFLENLQCKDAIAHLQAMNAKFRGLVTTALGIVEQISD